MSYPIAGRTMASIRPSRRYQAERGDGARWHAGVDVDAATGDAVLAPVSGRVYDHPWDGPARAVVVVGAGETWLVAPVEALRVGEDVDAGEQVGVVTSYQEGGSASHAHVQLWGARLSPPLGWSRTSWPAGAPPPADLVDPTERLTALAAGDAPRPLDTPVRRQLALQELGYDPDPPGHPWGERSIAALRQAQQDLGLHVDGIWGPDTEAAVRSALERGGASADDGGGGLGIVLAMILGLLLIGRR